MFGSGIARGMRTTLQHLFKTPVTVQYPEEVLPLPIGFRGRVSLVVNPETDRYRCTACGLCAKACPVDIIQIVRAKDEKGKPIPYPESYQYNLLECIFCGLCVEACPFVALTMVPDRELATSSREEADQTLQEMDLVASPEVDEQRVRVAGFGQMK
jgi:NADH-quinone oxidoreductase subunit I